MKNIIKQILYLTEKSLDSTVIAARWQRLKWNIKYLLGWEKYVPTLDVLKSRPHRNLLLNEINSFDRCLSLLEVGCGRGANLCLLAEMDACISLYGTDISETVIMQASSDFQILSIPAIFSVSKAEELHGFEDKSVDVVLSDAVLMYLPLKQVIAAISEMLRVARLGIVINAWHRKLNDDQYWQYDEGAWIYDYSRLIHDICGQKAIITFYPSGIWGDRRWNAYGALIRVSV